MKGVYMFLAEGFEDIEALGTRDVLVRGGVDVRLVSITDEPFVVSAHGAMVGVDLILEDMPDEGGGTTDKDMFVFPGGLPGATNLAACRELISLTEKHYAQGGSLAAICAAPKFVLGSLKNLEKGEFTCYDGCQDALESRGWRFVRKGAVKSGRIITGRGPGHAMDFALALLTHIKGEEVASGVEAGMILECD